MIKGWTKGLILGAMSALFLAPLLVFADVPEVPGVDPLQLLVQLITQWKSMGPLAIGMAVVTLATQAIKYFAPEFQYKRLLVTVLSCAYGVVLGVSQGMPWLSVVVSVLITGGGAVAIYEAFKGVGKVVAKAQAPKE